MKSKWLGWTPGAEIMEKSTTPDPTKPSKPSFVGFDGSSRAHFPLTRDSNSASGWVGESQQPEFQEADKSTGRLEVVRQHPLFCPTAARETAPQAAPASEQGLQGIPAPPECPALPGGVRLIRYEPKTPPVAIDTCSVVTDLKRFIRGELIDLDARLHSPVQIRAGHGVFTILDRLRQVGLELEIQSFPTPDTDRATR